MSGAKIQTAFMRNERIDKLANNHLYIGLGCGGLSFLLLTNGIAPLAIFIPPIMMVSLAFILISRENTPICTFESNKLEYRAAGALSLLQVVPLDSIRWVRREVDRFVVESTYQKKPIQLRIENFKREELELLWETLNHYAHPAPREKTTEGLSN